MRHKALPLTDAWSKRMPKAIHESIAEIPYVGPF